jgi:hypothetical protein
VQCRVGVGPATDETQAGPDGLIILGTHLREVARPTWVRSAAKGGSYCRGQRRRRRAGAVGQVAQEPSRG